LPLLLNVPFAEKDEAKSLGARWNPQLKKWYVNDREKYHKFSKWFHNRDTNLIVCDYLYIAVGNQTCFKCKSDTKVISLAADYYAVIDDEEGESEIFNEEINFISNISDMPVNLQKFLDDNFKYSRRYSRTSQSYYFANHCNNCGVYQRVSDDGPFYIDSEESASKLVLYAIKLKNDLEFNAFNSWGSLDWMIKEYATFKVLDVDL